MGNNVIITEIISNTYASNTFVVSNNSVAVIFDAGASVEEVKKIVKNKKVVGVFITHAHFDHILNVKNYVNTFNATLYISSLGVEKLNNNVLNLGYMFNINVDASQINNVKVVEDNSNFVFDNININCIQTAGHSNCSVSYAINNKYLIVGDVLFKEGIGRYDFYDGNYTTLINSINKLNSLNINGFYCGHGSSFTR